jgi:hypothetical protein
VTTSPNSANSKDEPTFPAPDVFVEEALRCAKEAQAKGIQLRILGGLAIHLHSKNEEVLWNSLGRLGDKVFTDIDFASRRAHVNDLVKMFSGMGYTYNEGFLLLHGGSRLIFYGNPIPMVDVFVDKLDFCHPIELSKRLDVDYPTIPLADLLLEKLQIVQLNEKDVKDAIVLLRAHDVGDVDKETINIGYIAELLSKDWGFYYTFTTNLGKIKEYVSRSDVLADQRADLVAKIDGISKRIEDQPKSTGWKVRARVGTRKKWYQDVGESTL